MQKCVAFCGIEREQGVEIHRRFSTHAPNLLRQTTKEQTKNLKRLHMKLIVGDNSKEAATDIYMHENHHNKIRS